MEDHVDYRVELPQCSQLPWHENNLDHAIRNNTIEFDKFNGLDKQNFLIYWASMWIGSPRDWNGAVSDVSNYANFLLWYVDCEFFFSDQLKFFCHFLFPHCSVLSFYWVLCYVTITLSGVINLFYLSIVQKETDSEQHSLYNISHMLKVPHHRGPIWTSYYGSPTLQGSREEWTESLDSGHN